MLNLFKIRFIKDSGTLLWGNLVAQGIAFVAYIVLLRLFTPEDFGLCNVFFSYTEVLIILSTCKYEMAVVKADNDNEAETLVRAALKLNWMFALLLTVIGVVLALLGVSLSGLPVWMPLLIPVLVYFTGTNRVYNFVCNRYRKYQQLAMGEVVSVSGGTVTRILFGLTAPLWQLLHSIGLPVGSILGKVAGHIYLHRCAKTIMREQKVATDHLSEGEAATTAATLTMKETLRKHRNFPIYVMPKELVSSFSANLPLMWLSVYFEKPLLGLFSLALTFTQRPVNVLANSFEKVFYQSTVVKVTERRLIWHDVRRFALLLGAGALAVGSAVFFFAEPLFVFLFGDQWIGTGYYVRCLLPWMGILVVTNSLSFVANVFGTQRVDFCLQLLQLLLRVGALYTGIAMGDFKLAVLLFAAVSAVVQAVQGGWYLYQTYRYDKRCKRGETQILKTEEVI